MVNKNHYKYSVITGFLGGLKDRFIQYQDDASIEKKLQKASQIEGCSGVEMIYPQDFADKEKVKNLLEKYNLGVSAVNLNVKSEEKWRFGSFSSPDQEIREEAVEYLKQAMDLSAELNCNLVTCCHLADGADYPFELDYERAFNDTIEAIRTAADYRDDVKISIEYKNFEPRMHCLLGKAGKTAYLCNLIDRENVGVTLDVGHAFLAQEVPADSAAFLGTTDKLFVVHINDNYRNWDWDMVPGTVNFWDYIEFILYLDKVGYKGYITADVFPQRHNQIKIMEKTFEWMDYFFEITEEIDENKLFEMMNNKDAFDILDYVRSKVGK